MGAAAAAFGGCNLYGVPDDVVDAPGPDGTLIDAEVEAYLKASNTDAGDGFGVRVAMSADGSTLAVAAMAEASESTGIDGDQGNSTSAPGFGAVYVFAKTGGVWAQQAYVKASIVTQGSFGSGLALSADGDTLAVGAYMDTQPTSIGAVYVFVRTGTSWAQQARLLSPNAHDAGFFGNSVALSADGNTLAAGAYDENSIGAPGPGQTFAGAVHVYTRSGTLWSHQQGLKGAQTEAYDYVGCDVALSGDGNTLAFGACGESGGTRGVNGNELDNSMESAGAVYIAVRAGTTWSQQAYIKPSTVGPRFRVGTSVALSADGQTLAAGTPMEADNEGAVYVFARSGMAWTEHAAVRAPTRAAGDGFGADVALTLDGSVLLAGAPGKGVSAPGSGAVYELVRDASSWLPRRSLEASNPDGGDGFGSSVAITRTGGLAVAGAPYEASAARGVDGNPDSNMAMSAGAAYVLALP